MYVYALITKLNYKISVHIIQSLKLTTNNVHFCLFSV
jgi:hypothetical protein